MLYVLYTPLNKRQCTKEQPQSPTISRNLLPMYDDIPPDGMGHTHHCPVTDQLLG